MTKAEVRKLLEFYYGEIEKSKKSLFASHDMRKLRKFQNRIRFYEGKIAELKN